MPQVRRELSENIRNVARNLTTSSIRPTVDELDQSRSFPHAHLTALGDAGLFGIAAPPTLGGQMADARSFVGVVEEISRAAPSTALVYTAVLSSCLPLMRHGSEKQKSEFVPKIALGEWKCGVAISTHPGGDQMNGDVIASREGDRFRLDGAIQYVIGAHGLDSFLVRADVKGEGGGPSLFLVRHHDAGFQRGGMDRRLGLASAGIGELRFENCVIGPERVIGGIGKGVEGNRAAQEYLLLGVSAMALGMAQECFDTAVRLLRETQNEYTSTELALIRQNVAGMQTRISAMRAIADLAAFHEDTDPPGIPYPTYRGRIFCLESALEVAASALQLAGGKGFSEEAMIERMLRDARVLAIILSTTEQLKDALGEFIIRGE
ncbi:MAG: Acyl-CoA dehydrogenase, short-chain specific [Myxococcota bacterium]|nr:Acyl-CoA dehydrogenase, short-chain specific [Myxococcota bacterium]